MNRYALTLTAIIFVALAACNNGKPKPVSNSVSKTTVQVNNKKDSVINNPEKNYGNATLSEPCVKCVIEAVKADDNYKKRVVSEKAIKFVINYVKTVQPQDTLSEVKATNALRVDIIDKNPNAHRILSYLYDNNLGKLYFLRPDSKTEVKADANSLKKIRNSCYWGVASGN